MLRYLYARRSLIGYAAAALLLEALIAFLYGALRDAMAYCIFLQAFILLAFLLLGFVRFRRRLKAVRDFENALFDSDASLPPPTDALEAQYQALLSLARARYDERRRADERAENERLDYYTLWVHQIKTPISAMRLLLDGRDDDALLKQELFKVERYADLALEYARMRELSSDLTVDRCDLRALVKGAVKKYALLFVYQKLKVTIEPFDQIVLSDEKWLVFILEQLLSNAVKYTKEGGVTFAWRDGCLIIADTGVGIRAEDVPRVFEKGFTGYNGRVDRRASGIGLYLTKRVCDALSIKITLKSRLGHGTTVTLHFPEDER